MVALLVFIIANLEVAFGRKKLLDAKGPFGDNVIKIRLDILSQEYLSATKQLSTMKKPSRSFLTPCSMDYWQLSLDSNPIY